MAVSKQMTLTTLTVPGLKAGTEPLSSIPLILPDNFEYDAATMRVTEKKDCTRTKLCVVPEAVEMLKTIKDPLSILGICGPARTGKSYILSRCLGRPDAFELGHHMDPKTFGIWIGTTALKGTDRAGKPIQLLLMDTEGIDAVSAEQKDDAGIFVLTILLCSMLVYNSQNVPYKRDLDKLECFSRLASSIQIKQGEDIDISDDEYFPDLLWLLRDVSLIIPEGADGKPMDPTEYIKKRVLKGGTKLKKTAEDETAETILLLFPNIEAYTLPIPHADKEVMQNIAAHTEKLNREFETGVQALVDKLIVSSTQKPKRGFDKMSKVTGDVLSMMVEEYVKAINDPNAIPEMKSTWDAVMDRVVRESMEELVVDYKEQMHAMIEAASTVNGKKEPMEVYQPHHKGDNTLMSIHSMVFDDVNRKLRGKIEHFGAGINFPDVVKQFQNMLVQYEVTEAADGMHQGREVCGGELKRIMERNYVLSEEYCTNLYHTLFKGIKDKMEHHVEKYNFEAFTKDVERLNAEYNKTAKGPAKVKVMQKMDKDVTKTHGENFKKLKGYQNKAFKAQQEAKEKELEARKRAEELNALRNESIMMKEQHQKNLNEMRNSMAAQMKQMEQEERERREKDMKRMQDLQESNFKAFASSIQESNAQQMEMFTKMMDQMRESQEKQAEETRNLIEAIKPPPPPPPPAQDDSSCIIL